MRPASSARALARLIEGRFWVVIRSVSALICDSAASASKRKHTSLKSGGPGPIKRSMSAVLLPRSSLKEPSLARAGPSERAGLSRSQHGSELELGELQELRRLSPATFEALALRVTELRRLGKQSARTAECGTQTVADVGTQTAMASLGVGAEGDWD